MTACRTPAWPVLLVAALCGCGGEETEPTTTSTAPDDCPAPSRVTSDGRCLEPGVQDDGSPAGTLGLDDGSCRPAGIPAELCGDGFEPSGDRCEPILPPDACGPGLMAVPGEVTCRAVMPCGAGTWGDLPVDGGTEYVDGAYAGGDSDGSAAKPWMTIADAVGVAAPGALIAVAEGSYVEDVVIVGKPVRLWGLCPEKAAITGTSADHAALQVLNGADGTEVGGVAVTGPAGGLEITGSQDVLVDRIWVHDTEGIGVEVTDRLGPTSAVLRASLVEAVRELGVRSAGADVTVEAAVVRGTLPRASDQELGRGINARAGEETGAPTILTLRASVIERNREVGVLVSGSDAVVEGAVVRDTLPRASDQTVGVGISAQDRVSTGARSTLVLRTSMIEDNHHVGVAVTGSDATIEATVVRDTQPEASSQVSGYGLHLQNGVPDDARSTVALLNSVVEHNHHCGVLVLSSDLTAEQAVVRGTLPVPLDQSAGLGVAIEHRPGLSGLPARSTLALSASVVEDNHVAGLLVSGSDATVEGTVVRGTVPRVSDQFAGFGIGAQLHPSSALQATLSLRASVVESNHDSGAFIVSSEATVVDCLFADTQPDDLGRFGDGMVAYGDGLPPSVLVANTRIEQSARAAVSNFGGFVSIGRTTMQCQSFDLEGELSGVDYSFEDRGQNLCGCPVADGPCLISSAGLEPPTSIAPIE